jgi:nucleoid DNA-binding protein
MEEMQAKKAMTKTEVFVALANATGLTKQQVVGVFDELSKLIAANLAESGPGVFAVPDLLQIKVVRKPAVAEHEGINPFTKQPMVIKAKPAKNVVKLVALKGLKSLV